MTDITACRQQLEGVLGEVERPAFEQTGPETLYLRASGLELDNVNPPVAMVGIADFEWDDNQPGGRGVDVDHLKITLLVSRANEKTGQRALDAYLAKTGPSSIKAALEVDRKLGGLVDRLRVSRVENYGFLEVGGVVYLGCEIVVDLTSPRN